MNKQANSVRKIGTFSSISVATLLLILLLSTAVYSMQPAVTQDQEYGQWLEFGSSSASGGGISDNNDASHDPSLAISPGGTPMIAWNDQSDDNNSVYLRFWNGGSWVELGSDSASGGGISNSAGQSADPSLAFSSNGIPVVAWQDDTPGNNEIYVRRWNGTIWVEYGSGAATGGGISDDETDSNSPSMAIGPTSTPIIAWHNRDESLNEDIYVRYWNGAAWVELGSGSASDDGISATGIAILPSLAISPDGTPIVAWQNYNEGNWEIYVRQWNGADWVEMGSGSASGGGITNNSGDSRFPSLAISPEGTPFAAWQDDSNGDLEIYVAQWDGEAWVEVGSGSASGGGISNNDKDSRTPTLAVSPDGTPMVAWRSRPDDEQIYLRRWNGEAWVELNGSASGVGISNNPGESNAPSLAIGSDGIPIVSWQNIYADDLNNNFDIYARQWQPALPPIFLPAIFNN